VSALYQLLSGGQLTGWGRFGSRVAELAPIPKGAWKGLAIRSLEDSNLIERSKNQLEIFDVRVFPKGAAPASTFHVKPTDSYALPSVTLGEGKKRRRPVAEQVATALEKMGLAQDPGGCSIKEIGRMIAPMMSAPPKTPEADLALRQAVARHYRRLGAR
jgi:hypothetical protein